ncbi:MAG: DUF2264 domain-containing protein [Spirochaetaceae bacterium]|nr:MAG: DUF2264 domain-containing protein [Spirochaetaceae bacterium]
MKKAFHVNDPDYSLSPMTGMTRAHYIECAKYVLGRAFSHVESPDAPFSFPLLGPTSYPQPDDPAWRFRSLEFEALERTFALAGPLIHVEPDVAINGIGLRDYYCRQFVNVLTPGHPNSLPLPEDLPDATYQFTCEFGGLSKTLLLMPDTLWPHLAREERDAVALTISKWAHHRTTQNNWRIFNILALSFLKKNGYTIDDDLLRDHLLWVLSYHSGDGWYLEQTYNYYSISLFIVYTTIWNRTFGDEHYPEIAETIERSAGRLMNCLPNFFGRDGFINMWSRSICYRTWMSAALPVAFMLKSPHGLDAGWARRLCSGSLLQFLTREDFYHNEIPSLGFYGPRQYMVQNYSCAASPFLMFLPFIALALSGDSPFWTTRENDGMWDGLGDTSDRIVLESPGLVLVNHGLTGTSEIVPGKVYYDDPNYSKLAYNTHFPWEDQNLKGGTSMEYAFRSLDPRDVRGEDVNFYLTGRAVENDSAEPAAFAHSQNMMFNGVHDGVVYRQAIMRRPPNNGVGYIIDLAEITIPGGVIRVDRSRLAFEYELTLGHFGLPHIDGVPATVESFQDAARNGATAAIPGRRVALIAYAGWDGVAQKVHGNRNAEADQSTVLYAHKKRTAKNPPMELMVTAMLHRTDDEPWSDDELSPISELSVEPIAASGSVLRATLRLANGESFTVDFNDLDGKRTC